MSQPQGQFDPNLAFAVLVGLCYGVFLALSHALSKFAPLVEIAAIQLAYGAFVLLLFAAWNWPGKTLELVFWGGGIWDCFNSWYVAFNKRLCFGACHAFGAFHLLPDRYRCDQRRSGF